MAVTIVLDAKSKGNFFSGGEKVRRGTIQLGTYVTNGIAVTPANFQLRSLDYLRIEPSHVNGELYAWDKANGKVKAYTAVGTEQTGADISANVARFEARGK
jgi:hypothetical protein